MSCLGHKRGMSRRSFLRAGALGAAALGARVGFGEEGSSPRFKQPNIVYFFADQCRADCVSPAGHPHIITPNLAALAERGIVFDRCYTNAPLCRPARSSMMTGLYPRETGVWNNSKSITPATKNHVQRIRDEAGYTTAVVGKTHLHFGTGHLSSYKCLLGEFGFNYAHELTGPLHVRDVHSAYTDWLTRQTPKGEQDKYQRARRYLRHYVSRIWKRPWDLPPPDAYPWLMDPEDHMDLYTGRTAADWIEGYQGHEPFYLQVNFPGPHNPYDSPIRYQSLYEHTTADFPEAVVGPHTGPRSKLTARMADYQNIRGMTPKQRDAMRLSYYAKVTLIDEAVGFVVDALAERGMLENTWIVFSSDHGDMLGDHFLALKGVFYEQSVGVPCIVRPPNADRGWKSSALIDHITLTATLLDIAGLDCEGYRGASMLPQLEAMLEGGRPIGGRDWVLSENFRYGMVRDERFKLVAHYNTMRPVELYDLDADPNELANIINRPESSKEVERLMEIYREAASG